MVVRPGECPIAYLQVNVTKARYQLQQNNLARDGSFYAQKKSE